jgi:peptidoglycan/xylan/chitin deacetylase (PgdA/CDA1 family)
MSDLYNAGCIIMLHRIVKEPKNPFNTKYTVESKLSEINHFIKISKSTGKKFVTIPQLVEEKSSNNIAITIDDGYVDMGLRVFKEHNVPFHIFITNCFINKTARLWWYDLEKHVSKMNDLNQKEKEKTFEKLRSEILQDESILNKIEKHNFKHVTLDWEKLRYLAREPLCTIGCHTYNHRNLTKLSKDDIIDEIISSKNELEYELDIDINSFSYPYGAHNGLVVELVKKYFDYAVTTKGGMYDSTYSKHMLPRIGAR